MNTNPCSWTECARIGNRWINSSCTSNDRTNEQVKKKSATDISHWAKPFRDTWPVSPVFMYHQTPLFSYSFPRITHFCLELHEVSLNAGPFTEAANGCILGSLQPSAARHCALQPTEVFRKKKGGKKQIPYSILDLLKTTGMLQWGI